MLHPLEFQCQQDQMAPADSLSCQAVRHAGELRAGIRTDSGHSCDADHDDQCQHDCVFDSRWAIFRRQKSLYTVCKLGHCSFLLVVPLSRAMCFTADDPQVQILTKRIPSRRIPPVSLSPGDLLAVVLLNLGHRFTTSKTFYRFL